jgi:hypothetical protein
MDEDIIVRFKDRHFLVGDDIFVISFSDLYDLFNLDALDISLMCYMCLSNLAFYVRHKQEQALHKKGKESPAFLNPQMMTRTNITLYRKDVVAYFVKAMSHYKNKEMLVIPFNTSNHWILLLISTMYDQV